jgi:hypothetical protein
VNGTVIDANGRPLAHAAVNGDAREGRYWAPTNVAGEFELRVPKSVKVESYDVWLQDRLVTDITVEKRNPLVLKVKSISASGGYEFTHRKKDTTQAQLASAPHAAQIVQVDSVTAAPQAQKSREPTSVSPKPPATAPSPAVRKIAGRVVDHEGKPIAAARLWWVVLWSRSHAQDFTVAGTSGADGRFEMIAPAEWKTEPPLRLNAGVLWILAPEKVVKKISADGSVRDGMPADLVVQLDPATEIVYKVNDPLGRPVRGAVVEPQQFFHTGATTFFPEALSEALRGITDKSGIALLRSIPPHVFCTVRVTAPGFGTQRFGWNKDDATAAERTLRLRPVGRITGRLMTTDPQSLRGIKLVFNTTAIPAWTTGIVKLADGKTTSSTIRESEGTAVVAADATGRFVVPAIAEGDVKAFCLDVPAKSALLPNPPALLSLQSGETLRVDIPTPRPILVRGTILTQDTRQPVVGAEISVDTHSGTVVSDGQGRYEAHALPGPAWTQVICLPTSMATSYVQTGESADKRVEIPDGANSFELPPILLAPIELVEGTLIDHIGRRLADARVCGIGGRRGYGFTLTNAEGEFSLHLPKMMGVDSFEAWLPDQAEPVKSVKIMKYRPLVLCVESLSRPEARQRETGDKHFP